MKKNYKKEYKALLKELNCINKEQIELLEDRAKVTRSYIELAKSHNYLLEQHRELTELYVAMANYVVYVQGGEEEVKSMPEEKDGRETIERD